MVFSRLDDGSIIGWLQTKRGMHSIYFQAPYSSSSSSSSVLSDRIDASMIKLDEELVDIIQCCEKASHPGKSIYNISDSIIFDL